MKKLGFLLPLMIIVLAFQVFGAINFQDNFTRADSSVVGGSWTEGGSSNWAINSNTLYQGGAGTAEIYLTAGHDAKGDYNGIRLNTSQLTGIRFDSKNNAGDRILAVQFSSESQIQYYSPSTWYNCGGSIKFFDNDWIFVNKSGSYQITLYRNNASGLTSTNICNISTTYNFAETVGFMQINGVTPNRIHSVCSANITSECDVGRLTSTTANISVSFDTPPSITNGDRINNGTGLLQANTTGATVQANLTIFLYNTTGLYQSSSVLTNQSNQTQLNFSGLHNGQFYYNATLRNMSGTQLATSSTVGFYNDLVFPVIILNPNNEFNIYNESVRNAYDNLLYLNMTFTDDTLLYAYEVNITKGGVVYFNETNSTMTGTSATYYKNLSINWNSGVYDIAVYVSDAHTAQAIPAYETIETADGIAFKTQTGNTVEIKSSDTSTTDSLKTQDSYEFSFNFKDKLTTDRTFEVITDKCPITYLPYSPYKAHFVTYCPSTRDGNWIDFEGEEGQPIVNKVDDYHYTVYFSNLEPMALFQSIGGLNIYNANFTWYKGNYSFTNATGLINRTTSLFLNMTNDSTHISSINATLTYNFTAEPVNTLNMTGYIQHNSSFTAPANNALYNFSWLINVTQDSGTSYLFTVNGSQLVQSYIIDDCTTGANTSFIVYYFAETSPSGAEAMSLKAYIQYSPDVSMQSGVKEYAKAFTSATSHTFCISPADVPLYATAYFVYNSTSPKDDGTGSFIHRYYFLNKTLLGTDAYSTYNLYNIVGGTNVTSTYSTLKLTTRTSNDYKYYKNVIASLQRFYVDEGVWRTVQMDESGEYGIINFNILEKTADYRIIFVDRNSTNTLKTTQSMKFVCTSALCDLTYLLNPSGTTTGTELDYNTTYSNTTKVFTTMWNEPTGTTVTTRNFVWKNSITGIATICDSTQTANAGIYTCNASLYTGTIFVGLYQGDRLINGTWYELGQTSLSDFLPSGEGAFWAMMIMVICIMFGLFSPVGSIITGIIGLIIISLMGIFTPLTVTGIVVATVIGAVIGFKVKA